MGKLLTINNYYYRRGGAEVVFLEQNRLFREIGWEVVPFSMRHADNHTTPWEEYFVDDIEFGSDYSLWQKLVRVPKVINSREAQRKMNRLLENISPDIAHAHNLYHHISPSVLPVLKKDNIPVVLTLHDLKLVCPAYKMLTHDGICERCKGGRFTNVLRHRCLKESVSLSALVMIEAFIHQWRGAYEKYVDRFVVPSRFYMEKFVEWGWARERFVFIPNFVDVKGLEPGFDPGRGVVYFGRLAPEKGLATLIGAAAATKTPLIIAGSGPEEACLKAKAQKLGAEVSFSGYLSGESLYDVIRSTRAVVLPSEWYENAPISILEAYALGKPVIGAAIGGITELVREGETGFTFEAGNVTALSAILAQLADLPDTLLTDMGHNARRWVEQEFTAARYRMRLLRLYAELGIN